MEAWIAYTPKSGEADRKSAPDCYTSECHTSVINRRGSAFKVAPHPLPSAFSVAP